jgi:hypothetical protein
MIDRIVSTARLNRRTGPRSRTTCLNHAVATTTMTTKITALITAIPTSALRVLTQNPTDAREGQDAVLTTEG